MPGSISGIGTTFYGQRHFQADGSYLTTEWLIFFYCPVFPIRSVRILRLPGADKFTLLNQQMGHLVLSQERVCWPQVFSTYGFVLGSQIWMVFVVGVLAATSESWKDFELTATFAAAAVVALPFLLVLWCRVRAKRAAKGRHPHGAKG